jgi:hypothetical protein
VILVYGDSLVSLSGKIRTQVPRSWSAFTLPSGRAFETLNFVGWNKANNLHSGLSYICTDRSLGDERCVHEHKHTHVSAPCRTEHTYVHSFTMNYESLQVEVKSHESIVDEIEGYLYPFIFIGRASRGCLS